VSLGSEYLQALYIFFLNSHRALKLNISTKLFKVSVVGYLDNISGDFLIASFD
jgi:hypothetical protein